MIELSEKRGLVLSKKSMQRILNGYKLDGDIQQLQIEVKARSLEILNDINSLRYEQGWQPLNNELPKAIMKLKAASDCDGDKACLRHRVPSAIAN